MRGWEKGNTLRRYIMFLKEISKRDEKNDISCICVANETKELKEKDGYIKPI